MFLYSIEQPGSRLDYQDEKWVFGINNLLSFLLSSLAEAGISAYLVQQQPSGFPKNQPPNIERLKEIEEEFIRNENLNKLTDYMEIADRTRIAYKREQWQKGDIPRVYISATRMVYAKSFIYSLDQIGKALNVLDRTTNVPQSITTIKTEYEQNFPSVKQIRDSLHHMEDRVRGKVRENDIRILPVTDILYDAIPALILGRTEGDKFVNTNADGTVGSIRINESSFISVNETVQKVYNIFNWTGSKVDLPT